MTTTMTAPKPAKHTPVAVSGVDRPRFLATIKAVGAQPELNRSGVATVNNQLPAVWRVDYPHEAPSSEMPEIAHEKAREILQKNLSRAGLWKRP